MLNIRLVLVGVSSTNSQHIQTADIECIQYQFQYLAFNIYIQTVPKGYWIGYCIYHQNQQALETKHTIISSSTIASTIFHICIFYTCCFFKWPLPLQSLFRNASFLRVVDLATIPLYLLGVIGAFCSIIQSTANICIKHLTHVRFYCETIIGFSSTTVLGSCTDHGSPTTIAVA